MKNKNIILNSWIEDHADLLATESYSLVCTLAAPKLALSKMSSKFLKYFIKHMVLQSLTEYAEKELSDEAAYDYTRKAFFDLKTEVQNDISRGFEEAFKAYSGKDIEYYCTINPVPQPINKELC